MEFVKIYKSVWINQSNLNLIFYDLFNFVNVI